MSEENVLEVGHDVERSACLFVMYPGTSEEVNRRFTQAGLVEITPGA